MADTLSSGGSASNRVRVQISSSAPNGNTAHVIHGLFYLSGKENRVGDSKSSLALRLV